MRSGKEEELLVDGHPVANRHRTARTHLIGNGILTTPYRAGQLPNVDTQPSKSPLRLQGEQEDEKRRNALVL